MTAVGSPQVPILKITHSGTTASATMGQAMGLSVGSTFQVKVSGASPSVYDGTFNATYEGSNIFQYTLSSSPGSNASGQNMTAVNPMQVTLSSLTFGGTGGTTATGTSSTALGLSTGTQFELSVTGASPSTYDGTFTATVTGSTTFTYTLPSNPGTNASGSNMIAGLNLPTLDGTIGRVTGMQDEYNGTTPGANNTAILGTYQYLGLNQIVQENRPQPGVDLTYIHQPNDTLSSSDGGDRYTGLDRFGRVIDQYWTNVNSASSGTVDRFQYGYDQDGNVLYKNNLVNSTFSELYHANSSVSGDNSTAYDSLNRLQAFRRGTLSASGNNGSGGLDTVSTLNTIAGSSNSWNYDALGNQTSTQGGSQTRTFNAQNQITGISSLTTPTYDNNGNMTKDQAGNTYTYNAWNQMVTSSVKSEVMTYTADGLLFTDATTVSGHTTTVYQFHSPSGQVLADLSVTGSNHFYSTYVWGGSYIDDLIEQDAGSLGSSRTYVQQDANHNVTAVLSNSGVVTNRFVYDPYGAVTELTSGWSTVTGGQGFVYGFQGGRYDANIALYYFRARWYDPTTGTWMQEDKAYWDGASLYIAFGDNPAVACDPYGFAHTAALSSPDADCGHCKATVTLKWHAAGVVGQHTYISIADSTGKEIGTIGGEPETNSWYNPILFLLGGGSGNYGSLVYEPDQDINKGSGQSPINLNGQSACDFLQCADAFANELDKAWPYHPLDGPNSNTFTHAILAHCHAMATPPSRAVNWNWHKFPPPPPPGMEGRA